jgi:hypothetical protein
MGVNQGSRSSDAAVGLSLAIIGNLALLCRLNILTISLNIAPLQDLKPWWPMLLICWGIGLLFMEEKQIALATARHATVLERNGERK